MPQKDAFTIEYSGISNTLITRCSICEAFDPHVRSMHPKMTEVDALWDTGATGTVISKNLAEKLQLKPQGQQKSSNTAAAKSRETVPLLYRQIDDNMQTALL
jgi:predicted aspartyl protease